MGLVDAIVPEGQLRQGAIDFAKTVLAEKRPLVKVRDNDGKLAAAKGHPEIFANFRKANARKFRGFKAPEANIRCIEAAVNLPFEDGLKVERKLFGEVMMSPESAAQRYYFFAERQANKIPDVPDGTATIPIEKIGIIGAGTMGGGIAMNFVNAGIPVTLVEVRQEALDRGLKVVRGNYERSAKNGRFPLEEVDRRMAKFTGSLDMASLADCDLVIEAVFERMDVKKDIFTKLDAIVKPGAILATNTSGLNIDEIASVTKRPEFVIGLHFFSPANVMKLLEIVRADHTSKEVINTSLKLARTIGKIAVLVGVTPGFVGNRILGARGREAQKMVLEGAMPWDVDRVLYDFGFPMGPFAMSDLAGLDIGWVREKSHGETIRDVLCEMDRRGQKTGAGYYDYDPETRAAKPSPVTETVIRDFVAKSGRNSAHHPRPGNPRTLPLPDDQRGREDPGGEEGDPPLRHRRGVGQRLWRPVYRGGPMYYADRIGLDKVVAKLKEFQATMATPSSRRRCWKSWRARARPSQICGEGFLAPASAGERESLFVQ